MENANQTTSSQSPRFPANSHSDILCCDVLGYLCFEEKPTHPKENNTINLMAHVLLPKHFFGFSDAMSTKTNEEPALPPRALSILRNLCKMDRWFPKIWPPIVFTFGPLNTSRLGPPVTSYKHAQQWHRRFPHIGSKLSLSTFVEKIPHKLLPQWLQHVTPGIFPFLRPCGVDHLRNRSPNSTFHVLWGLQALLIQQLLEHVGIF